MATEIFYEDTVTGAGDAFTIENDFMIIVDGDTYVDGYQTYSNGTVVLTIKKRKDKS
jgi:hypothetical protein